MVPKFYLIVVYLYLIILIPNFYLSRDGEYLCSFVLSIIHWHYQWRVQDFKLGGGALKKIAPSGGRQDIFLGYFVWKITILRQKIIFFPIAEGGAKFVGVFRVKNHDLTPKNHIFSNCRERRENIWGISCEKSRFYAKKSYFFQF